SSSTVRLKLVTYSTGHFLNYASFCQFCVSGGSVGSNSKAMTWLLVVRELRPKVFAYPKVHCPSITATRQPIITGAVLNSICNRRALVYSIRWRGWGCGCWWHH